MTVDVITEIAIECPRAVVAANGRGSDQCARLVREYAVGGVADRSPLRVGSRMAVVAHFLGRRLAYAYEVAEIVLDERLVLRTADGPFPMETTYVWESLGDGRTRMALRNRGTPTGFGNIAAPFLSAAMRGANCKDLARLKEILEARRPG